VADADTIPPVRIQPLRGCLPFSSTGAHEGLRFFNQYVHPAESARFGSGFVVPRACVQWYTDGVPIQIIIWKERALIRRALSLPAVDRRHRATFEADAPGTPFDPMQCRVIYDPQGRSVRLQCLETTRARCIPIATQTLVEVTGDGRLAALWMLEVGGAEDDAHGHMFGAINALRARTR